MKSWVDKAKAAWRRFMRRHIVADDPHETSPLPQHAIFIVNGTVMDTEGLRVYAHGAMFPKSVRKQTWN